MSLASSFTDGDGSPPIKHADLHWRATLATTAFIRRAICDLRLEIQGAENVPAGEPLIIAAAPHRNGMDAFLLGHALPARPRLHFLGSREAIGSRWYNLFAVSLMGGVIPVATDGQLNRQALTRSLQALAFGDSLCLFPEGWGVTRQAPDRLMPLRRGVAFLAVHSGRRILPVGLAGTRELWRGKSVRMRVGQPLAVPAEGTNRQREALLLKTLEAALEALRPPLPPEPANGHKPWPWLTDLAGG